MLFDLIVLGTDPAGLELAFLAASWGQSVAVLHDPEHFAPNPGHTSEESQASSIGYFNGCVKFLAPDSLEIANSQRIESLIARRILLATGTKPKRPVHVPFDGQKILTSDEMLLCEDLPQNVLVVGAGEHGIGCAAHLVKRGARVSLVDQSLAITPKGIPPRIQALWRQVTEARSPVHWGTTVLGVESRKAAVTVFYDNGSIETYGAVAFAVGRIGCTEQLGLPRTDLLLDESFRIWCNERGQTDVSHIYAAGSVVGFPRFPGMPREEAEHLFGQMLTEDVLPRPPAFLKGKKRVPSRRAW